MLQKIEEDIRESRGWLIHEADDDSGGWGERKGSHANALNTAEVVLALLDSGLAPGNQSIVDGTSYLMKLQREYSEKCPKEAGSWPRQITLADGSIYEVPDIVRTSFALHALVRSRSDAAPEIELGLKWLLERQNSDGGWGFSRQEESAYMPTCLGLMTLFLCYDAGARRFAEQINNGYKSFLGYRNSQDGSFGKCPPLTFPHTVFAVLLFKAALSCDLSGTNLEKEQIIKYKRYAVKFLVDNHAKTRVDEESFPIDPERGLANYRFRYMTDELLLLALAGSQDGEELDARRDVLGCLQTRRTTEGGFYGDRVSTWATARAVSGLCAARDIPPVLTTVATITSPEINERKLEPATWMRGTAFLFVFLYIGATTFLIYADKLNPLGGLLLFAALPVVLAVADLLSGKLLRLMIKDIWEALSAFWSHEKPKQKPALPQGGTK